MPTRRSRFFGAVHKQWNHHGLIFWKIRALDQQRSRGTKKIRVVSPHLTMESTVLKEAIIISEDVSRGLVAVVIWKYCPSVRSCLSVVGITRALINLETPEWCQKIRNLL